MALGLPKAVEAQPDAHALLWLTASVALGVAGHADHLPLWLMLVIACLMTWRYLALRRRWRLPGITLRIIASVALVIALYQHYGLATGRVAGAGWLAGLVGLQFLELRAVQRDFALVILMGLAVLFIDVFGVKRRDWNLILSGAGLGVSLIIMVERFPGF